MKTVLFLGLSCSLLHAGAQNVGIGTNSPSTPLHIRSGTLSELLRIEGANPYISFFDGSVYSGYLWYNTNRMELGTPSGSTEPVVIAPGRLATVYVTTNGRVGIGISAPSETLDVNGNINFTGVLKVNGSSGLSGQVLTSAGTGDPQWKDAAYSNNTRFCFTMNQTGASSAAVGFNATRYNLNGADIVRNPNSITINRSGLYHFDINLNIHVDYSSGGNSGEADYVELMVDGIGYHVLLRSTRIPNEPNSADLRITQLTSLDLHITAPATITIRYNLNTSGSAFPVSHYVTGQFIGNLVAE